MKGITDMGLIYIIIGIFLIGWCMFSKSVWRSLFIYLIYITCIEGVMKQLAKTNSTATFIAYPIRDAMIWILVFKVYFLQKGKKPVPSKKHMPQNLKVLIILFVILNLFQILASFTDIGLLISIFAIRPYLEWLPIFLLAYKYMRTKQNYIMFSSALLFCVSLNGIAGTIQYIKGPGWMASLSPGYNYFVYEQGRVFTGSGGESLLRPPALGNDCGFGGMLAMYSLPFLFYLFVQVYKKRMPFFRKVILFLATILSLMGAISSISRTVIVVTILESVIIIFLILKPGMKTKAIFIRFFIILAGAFIIFLSQYPTFFVRYQSISTPQKVWEIFSEKESSRRHRIENLPKLTARYFFGGGLGKSGSAGGFVKRYDILTEPKDIPFLENQYEYTLLDLGMLGVILWLLIHLMSLKTAFYIYRRSSKEIKYACLALVVILSTLLPVGWFFGTMQGISGAAFWFACGCVFALKNSSEETFML